MNSHESILRSSSSMLEEPSLPSVHVPWKHKQSERWVSKSTNAEIQTSHRINLYLLECEGRKTITNHNASVDSNEWNDTYALSKVCFRTLLSNKSNHCSFCWQTLCIYWFYSFLDGIQNRTKHQYLFLKASLSSLVSMRRLRVEWACIVFESDRLSSTFLPFVF